MTQTADQPSALAVPEKILGQPIPRTLEALEAILEKSKGEVGLLPLNAAMLERIDPQLKDYLYLVGGIPAVVNPVHVGIFAGHPYVGAAGAVQAALDTGRLRSLTYVTPTQPIDAVPCKDPNSGCPSWHSDATSDFDLTYRCTLSAMLDTGQRIMAHGTACPHNWQTYKDKKTGERKPSGKLDRSKLRQMAETRARRRLCMPLIGLAESEYDDDVIDGEIVDGPSGATAHEPGSDGPTQDDERAEHPDAPAPDNVPAKARASQQPEQGTLGDAGAETSEEVGSAPASQHASATLGLRAQQAHLRGLARSRGLDADGLTRFAADREMDIETNADDVQRAIRILQQREEASA